MKRGTSSFFGALVLGLAACAPAAAPPATAPTPLPLQSAVAPERVGDRASVAPGAEDERFRTLEHDYAVYFMSRFPVVATYLGGAAFDPVLADVDGQLRDPSAAALVEEDKRWEEFRVRVEALKESQLSVRRQIDRRIVLAQLEFLKHQHQVRRQQERALDSYVDEPFRGVDWQIQGMTPTGPGTLGTSAEWRLVIARERAIPKYLAAAEQQLGAGVAANNTPDWRVLAQYGLQSTRADAEYGIHVDLRNSSDPCVLPPELRAIKPAEPGEYRLRETGEVIVDPNFVTTWTCIQHEKGVAQDPPSF
jgi:hypothetical protein